MKGYSRKRRKSEQALEDGIMGVPSADSMEEDAQRSEIKGVHSDGPNETNHLPVAEVVAKAGKHISPRKHRQTLWKTASGWRLYRTSMA